MAIPDIVFEFIVLHPLRLTTVCGLLHAFRRDVVGAISALGGIVVATTNRTNFATKGGRMGRGNLPDGPYIIRCGWTKRGLYE